MHWYLETPPLALPADSKAEDQLTHFDTVICQVTLGWLSYCLPSKRLITVSLWQWMRGVCRDTILRI